MEVKNYPPPLTVEDQIKNLISIGLIIENEEEAKKFLNDVSYFRLIKAYSLGLKPKNGNYYSGISFNQIVSLYKFNSDFRQLLFKQVERVEINLRCRVANYFSTKYGIFGYECSSNFQNPQYHFDFLEDIQEEIHRNSRSPFVKNFQDNYCDGKIPMYALVELFSFGTLSKFFKNMKNEDKKMISSTYNVGWTYFESWIESIAYVRNICAHYGRIYNAKLAKRPTLYKQYSRLNIDNSHIFSTLICLSRLMPQDVHWLSFVDQIELLIENYPYVKIELMGFPNNWKSILLNE